MNATKKLLAALFALTLVAGQALSAQTIKTPAFAQPLVEQWVKVYNESHPDQTVSMSGKGAEADIQIVVSQQQAAQLGQTTTTFGRLAILPFAIEGSEAAQAFASRKISKTRLEHIYFNLDDEDDEFGDYVDANKGMTIYSGNSQASVANSFAEHFGLSATDFRGKRIQGDDRYVNLAVSRDQKGLAFNALANLYDLQTRQLKEGIQLLHLDVKRDIHQALEQGSLDDLIASLEENRTDVIATSEIGLNFDIRNENANRFVDWVLTEGVRYNHQYGLLNYNEPLQASK